MEIAPVIEIPNLRRIGYLIDWDDPENRYRRHQQKVINQIREWMGPDYFRVWWVAFCDDDADACEIFELMSKQLRQIAEAQAAEKVAQEMIANGTADSDKMARRRDASEYWRNVFATGANA